MKYIEYVYLALAVMCLIFLAAEFEYLPPKTKYLLLGVIALFSFMFSFRRKQRIRWDRHMQEEMRKLEEDE